MIADAGRSYGTLQSPEIFGMPTSPCPTVRPAISSMPAWVALSILDPDNPYRYIQVRDQDRLAWRMDREIEDRLR